MNDLDSSLIDISEVYKKLLDEKFIPKKGSHFEHINKAIASVKNFQINGTHRVQLMQIIFDVICIDIICRKSKRGVMSKLCIEDAALLGKLSERKQKLLKVSKQQYDDWHFANRIRAWIKSRTGYHLPDLKDDSRMKGRKVCDFFLPHRGKDFFVECKRVRNYTNQPYEKYKKKLAQTAEDAASQILSSIQMLGSGQALTCLVIDVTDFMRDSSFFPDGFSNFTICGWNNEQIQELLAEARGWDSSLHNIILCWDNVCVLDKRPIAILQRTAKIARESDYPFQIYGDWMVDYVIMNECTEGTVENPKLHMFSVHNKIRNFDWMEYNYRMISNVGRYMGEIKWNSGD